MPHSIIMKNVSLKLEEKEIVEDNDMMGQIIASEKNIKKGKIKEFNY